MKKRILVLLLAVAMLAGCGKPAGHKEEPIRNKVETVPVETENDRDYDNSLLSEFFYERTIGEGDSRINIRYYLPEILDDTQDAENLNELFHWFQQEAEESDYPVYETITWESFWNDSLLSIVLAAQPLGQGEWNFITVNYDFAEGREVLPWELPEWAGLPEENVVDALRRTAAQEFDRATAEVMDSYGECFDDLIMLRAATLSEYSLNLEMTPLYLDGDGDLNAALTLYTMTGGGYSYAKVPLVVYSMQEEKQTERFANASVEVYGFSIQVTFDEWNQESEDDVYLGNVEPGAAYTVDGFYGEVQDMTIGPMGISGDAYLVVTDQMGQLYYCNLSKAARAGGGFRLAGPLQNPRGVVSISAAPEEREIYAVTEDGQFSVMEAIGQAELESAAVLDGTVWMTEDGSATAMMALEDDGMTTMNWESEEDSLAGFYYFDGITEEGLHFRADLADENSFRMDAVMTFSVPDWWDYSTSVMTLTFPDTGDTWELTMPQE